MSTEVSGCLPQKLGDPASKRFIFHYLVIKRCCLLTLAGLHWIITYVINEWLTGKNVKIIRHHHHHHHYHHHHHTVVSFTIGLQPLPNRVLYTVRSSASSFNFQNPLFSLTSSNSWLRLLPRLLFPSIFFLSNVFKKAVSTPDVTNPASLHVLIHFPFYLPIYKTQHMRVNLRRCHNPKTESPKT